MSGPSVPPSRTAIPSIRALFAALATVLFVLGATGERIAGPAAAARSDGAGSIWRGLDWMPAVVSTKTGAQAGLPSDDPRPDATRPAAGGPADALRPVVRLVADRPAPPRPARDARGGDHPPTGPPTA